MSSSSDMSTGWIKSGKSSSEYDKAEMSKLCFEATTSVLNALFEHKELQKEANSLAISRGLEIIPLEEIIVEKVAGLDALKLLTLFQSRRQSRSGLREFKKLVQVCLFAILHSLLTMAHALL